MSDRRVFKTAAITGTGTGDNTIIAAVTGRSIYVWKIFFTCAGAVNVTFKDGTTALSGAIILTANGSSMSLSYDGAPWFSTTNGNAFVINSSGAVALSGIVHYTEG